MVKSIDLSLKIEGIFKTIAVSIGYLLALTPLVFGYFIFGYITTKILYIFALSEILFLCWLVLMIANKRYRKKVKSIIFSLGIFLIVMMIASIFGIDPVMSFWSNFSRGTGLLFLIHLFFMSVSTISIFDKKIWHQILSLMAFIGGIIALVIVCGYIGFLDKDLTIDYATFGNSSFLATYLLFCLFFAIYAGFQKEEKIIFGLLGAKEIRFLMRLSAVFCLIGLILSTGRASAASSVIGLMLLFILFLGFKGKNKTIRIVGKILAVLCVSGILFSVILLNIPNTFVQKEFSKFATNIRPVVWQISGELIKEKPILGYGMENFETAFASKANLSLFYASHGKELRFDKAHSIIWDTLISGGLLGLLSYLGIFAAVVYFLWKKRNKFWLFSSFLCLFLAYFLQNLTVFDSPITYFCFFIAISFLSFLETEPEKDQGKINILKGSTIILVIIIFIFSWFYFVHKQYIIVRMASSLIYEYKSEEEKIKIMEEFNKISIWGKYQTIELYVNDVLGKFKEQKLNPEFLKFALDQSMKVKKEKPNNYYNLILISNISRHLENFKLSEMVLKEAEAINNQNMYYLESLIDLKIAENQNKEVFEIIEKTIIREPRIQYLYEQALRLARLLKDESSVDKYATILQRRFNVLSP